MLYAALSIGLPGRRFLLESGELRLRRRQYRHIGVGVLPSGQPEVYVQPFPATGAKFQVSHSGGTRPVWRSDGKELFFLSIPSDMRLMAAAVDTAEGFRAAVPEPLFPVVSTLGINAGPQYAVSRDGKRFLVNALLQQTTAMLLTVVVNWLSAVAQ